jgi:hypothetical protein
MEINRDADAPMAAKGSAESNTGTLQDSDQYSHMSTPDDSYDYISDSDMPVLTKNADHVIPTSPNYNRYGNKPPERDGILRDLQASTSSGKICNDITQSFKEAASSISARSLRALQ